MDERTVASIPDEELIRRAVSSAGHNGREGVRWGHVRDVFGLGSTYSKQLCRRFGFDPDELVGLCDEEIEDAEATI